MWFGYCLIHCRVVIIVTIDFTVKCRNEVISVTYRQLWVIEGNLVFDAYIFSTMLLYTVLLVFRRILSTKLSIY